MASTHHEDYQLLIGALRDTRRARGIAQSELAAKLGVTQTFISKVERGERRLDPIELIEVLEALQEPVEGWFETFMLLRVKSRGARTVPLKIAT